MTWAAWLITLVGPIVFRVLATLGLSVVGFTGMVELVNALVASAQSSWSGLPAAVLGLSALAGMPEALGLVFGAFVARTALWAAMSATRLVFKA